jgi:hypothetical protein
LRKTAKERYNIDDFKVGSFVLAWKYIYECEASEWSKKHAEVFSTFSGDSELNSTLNVTAKLKADTVAYGAFPNGIKEGLPVTEFFGKQWGDMSKKVGLNAIVLRDGMLGVACYKRSGPFGSSLSPDTAKNNAHFRCNADLVKQTKLANQEALVIGYSSGGTAVADWRVNAFDIEGIAKEGYLDAYIDQTWAGAWNEIGQRYSGDDLYNLNCLGWTYQMGFMLLHGVMLENTKVKHYQLTETFDAWESWDIIHTAPDRLKWGIWAYSHAAVKTPGGLKMPDGAYISWCNQGTRLLSEKDVIFLADNLDEAYRDALQVKEVFGPTIVYNRPALEWQTNNKPDKIIKEWVDEYAAGMMKWGVPIMSVTKAEYLEKINTDLPILQTPVHLDVNVKKHIISEMNAGNPFYIIGTPAGGIDHDISALAGISTSDSTYLEKQYGVISSTQSELTRNMEKYFSMRQNYTANKCSKGVDVIYKVAEMLPADGSVELKFIIDDGGNNAYGDYIDFGNPELIQLNGEEVSLTWLKPVVWNNNIGDIIKNGNTLGEPIIINGKKYDTGLGFRAAAETVYHLPVGTYKKFESVIGLDDTEGKNGQVRITAYINGKQMYQSRLINKDNKSEKVSFAISNEVKVGTVESSPMLTLNTSDNKKIAVWDGPEYRYLYATPMIYALGGSREPFVMAARVANKLLINSNSPYIDVIHPDNTMNICAWQLKDGTYSIMAADLEEGLDFAPDTITSNILVLPKSWGNLNGNEVWYGGKYNNTKDTILIELDYSQVKLFRFK